ncbi:hypothetical protein AM587_10009666 [Phytophthora nicotianae]|uniref:RxLR effector protein n=1 Tax=Phytophthora nicotianae TaxID=4792 RepID=A0A0W8CKC4_PHYNI|nr:Pectinesterase [Phytophthora nicotianae]KUF84615.1 hypothetical protein AM587_10009666 [Phytophthora nicotianae]KUF89924.1 Acetyl-CoA carboxylase 1 [Phytophthora nicotianae]
MRGRHVLAFVVLAAVCSSRCEAVGASSERLKQTKQATSGATQWTPRLVLDEEPKRSLRVHKARKAKSDGTKSDEERAFTWAEVLNLGRDAAFKAQLKLKLQVSLAVGLKPDQVLILLQPTSTKDTLYRHYTKYFYDYFVKYLDEPMSHLPQQVIKNIWEARLHAWLQTDTPPQVFSKLKLVKSMDTDTFASAKGQKNYDIFEEFHKRWMRKQQKESTKPKLDIVIHRNDGT